MSVIGFWGFRGAGETGSNEKCPPDSWALGLSAGFVVGGATRRAGLRRTAAQQQRERGLRCGPYMKFKRAEGMRQGAVRILRVLRVFRRDWRVQQSAQPTPQE